MKKIYFNDKFGLTRAVLDGRKTITRRVLFHLHIVKIKFICLDIRLVKLLPLRKAMKPFTMNKVGNT